MKVFIRPARGPTWKILLSLPLSVLLLTSVLPSLYALETFRTFSGTDYLDIPNSSELQLSQFTVEARFRIVDDPVERGYLVSKGSAEGGNALLDQNYALFITPFKKIGGGFKSAESTYHYVYSPAVSNGDWHVAKLVYDGSRLRLSIDGFTAASKSIVMSPDNAGTGPLRIGANHDGPDKFFVGDIDYVKILDRSTFSRVYFNDFNQGTDPGPIPEPTAECSDVPMSQLRGTVFIDPILSRFENDGGPSAPADYVQDSMRYIKLHGMNLVRVPFYWEAYVSWPAGFMNELELIAQAADANDICVVFDNHHWYTSSYFADVDIGKTGTPKGFPSFVMQGYPTSGDYESVAGMFWGDFLTNNIEIEGQQVWDVQADFFAKIIEKVDGYDSVAGYEILNEPHLFDVSQYDSLGEYHTYMADKIRSMSEKKIIFNRETARGFQRDPGMEERIVPQGVSGLVYGPHLYSVPTVGSQGENQIDKFKQWSAEWGVEIMIGEWSAETQEEVDSFVFAFRDAGFAWTYYKWSAAKTSGGDHLGNVLYDSDSSPPTLYLEYLTNSLDAAY
ncbi:MAG: cellulase family glycosylhydrolase [Nitrososphaera sp.]|nr:cellulase family glycosylhydrolase [Nitrososphaera sp.]